jgi:hypothetical protein
MALLADQPERWPGMGAVSLEKVARHSINNTVQSYEKIYEALVAEARLPRLRASLRFRSGKQRIHRSTGPLGQ